MNAQASMEEPAGSPDFNILLKARLEELSRCFDVLESDSFFQKLPKSAQYAVELVFDELASNAIKHSAGGNDEAEVRMRYWYQEHKLTIVVDYDGPPFDPSSVPLPPIEAPLEERAEGGLGLFLVRNLMDSFEVSRQDERNYFLTTKLIEA